MLAEWGQTERAAQGARLAQIWQEIRQVLEAEKQRIFQEIHYYPPPIPACDVQFNSLLAERASVLQAMGRVDGLLKQRLPAEDLASLLNEFMRTSPYVNSELAERIRHSLIAWPAGVPSVSERC
jgi:hypothetical protein